MSKSNETTLNVPTLRFAEYTDEWHKFALSDFVTRVTRRNKNNESSLPLTISAQYGLIDQITFFNKTVASVDLSGYYLLYNGDFAYNKSYSNDYAWGAVKRLDKYEKGCLSSLYFVFRPTDKVDSDYLTHYFETNKWHKGISDIAGEGARNHGLLNMSVDDYFSTKHYLPTLPEQRKIADFLNLIVKRIEVQNKIISKYETLIKGLADRLCEECKTQYRFKDLYIKAGEGGTPTTDNDSYYRDGTIPFIKIEDLNSKYIVTNKDYISQLGLSKSSAWLIPANSVIYSNGATIGCVAINNYPIATKQGILGIIPSKIVLTEYLYYYLQTTYFRKQIKRVTVRGTMDCAYLKDINSISCFIPTITKQQTVVHILSSIDNQLLVERNILLKLKEQKNYLLSKMFI